MILFYLLVSIMPLVRNPLWSRFIGDLTLTKFVGIACLVYALLYLAIRRSWPRALQTPILLLFLLFSVLALFSFATEGPAQPWAMSPIASYASFLGLFFITAVIIDSRARLRWTLLVAIASLAFASIYVIREWQKYHLLYPGFRPGWEVGDPNYFSLSALITIPIAFCLMGARKSRLEGAFCLGCLVLTLSAMTLAASRGGFLGLGAALFFIAWRSQRRVRNFTILAALLIPLLLVSPNSPIQRFLHPTYGDWEGEQTRLELWRAGLRIIEDHPLSGIGAGNYKFVVMQYEVSHNHLEKIAHNTYLEVAAEMGIPGLLLFVGVLFCAFRTLEQTRRLALANNDPWLAGAATGICAGLVGCAVAILFLSAETQKFIWLMLFLAPCARSLTGGERHPSVSSATQPEIGAPPPEEAQDSMKWIEAGLVQ